MKVSETGVPPETETPVEKHKKVAGAPAEHDSEGSS
jgi:hypothetical protein